MAIKDDVLKILEKNTGKSVSGNHIAKTLNISRGGVWKAVKALKEQGHRITAATNRGYCLAMDSDVISEPGIRAHLSTQRQHEFVIYKTVDSTNTQAKLLAAQGAADGTVVIADMQTCGRGRMGRSFYSPGLSGIYLSEILRPGLSASDSLIITAGAAVAVCRAIEAVTGVSAQIKWVNDILIGGKKVCGILTEAAMDLESETLEYLVVGIGINVRPCKDGFPKELAGIATALEEHTQGKTIRRNRLIAALIDELDKIYTQHQGSFILEYKTRSMLIGKAVSVICGDARQTATVLDIDDCGRLVIRGEDGKIKTLSSGEISIRPL